MSWLLRISETSSSQVELLDIKKKKKKKKKRKKKKKEVGW
jgi:hypothetical protein